MNTYQKNKKLLEDYRKLFKIFLTASIFLALSFSFFLWRSLKLGSKVLNLDTENKALREKNMNLVETSTELINLQKYKFNQAVQSNLEEAYLVQDQIEKLENKIEEMK